MIIKFKIFDNYNPNDPYNEEKWDDGRPFKIGDHVSYIGWNPDYKDGVGYIKNIKIVNPENLMDFRNEALVRFDNIHVYYQNMQTWWPLKQLEHKQNSYWM